ncbi:protoporphyrinogen oxidase [Nocardioides caldifontis]|uniref:protoporphyrinogen oxidase n=1 Tax=Nocardioides caldifontis TaxID=2588938 RepID=UPI001EEFA392|nr:protoporphyrinogen oxidase [Nocardioides caldifontis]
MNAPSVPRVAVVGAGIAGLAAARAVREARPDVEVVVLDAADRVGGKLRLAEVGGVTLDVGAESMLNRRPEAVALARSAGLADRIVHPATIAATVWSRGALHRLPRSLLGVPAGPRVVADAAVLSRAGRARALLDTVLPPYRPEEDVSIGDLVERRCGAEVVDRLVEPLLGGVYAGHAREISAGAAAPQLVAKLREHGRLLRAASAAVSPPDDSTPVFAGLAGGVGQLPAAVARNLDVRTGTTVRALERIEGGRWRLVTGPVPAPEVVEADAVVVAVPAAPSARLLRDVAPAASTDLDAIEYASMAVVTTAFRRTDFPGVAGSGFLVPPVDGRRIKASTFAFRKWGWVDAASEELVLVRTSIGRHREEAALQVPDEELVAASVADLGAAVGLRAAPVDHHVQRWGGGLPQYAVGHPDRVRRIRASVAEVPGLAVCGAAYDGLGIPACIASGQRAAREVLDRLPTTTPSPAHERMDP